MARMGKGNGGRRKDYDIGYGKPPVHTRFKAGQSGNPRGKNKGHKSLKALVDGVLKEKVSIRTPRGVRKVTKFDALVRKLINDALTGDSKSVLLTIRLTKEAGLMEAEAMEAASLGELSDEDRKILASFMKPRSRR